MRSAKKALQTCIHAVAKGRRRLRATYAPAHERLLLKLYNCTVCTASAFRFSLWQAFVTGFCDTGSEISARPMLVGPILVHLQRCSRHYHRCRDIYTISLA